MSTVRGVYEYEVESQPHPIATKAMSNGPNSSSDIIPAPAFEPQEAHPPKPGCWGKLVVILTLIIAAGLFVWIVVCPDIFVEGDTRKYWCIPAALGGVAVVLVEACLFYTSEGDQRLRSNRQVMESRIKSIQKAESEWNQNSTFDGVAVKLKHLWDTKPQVRAAFSEERFPIDGGSVKLKKFVRDVELLYTNAPSISQKVLWLEVLRAVDTLPSVIISDLSELNKRLEGIKSEIFERRVFAFIFYVSVKLLAYDFALLLSVSIYAVSILCVSAPILSSLTSMSERFLEA